VICRIPKDEKNWRTSGVSLMERINLPERRRGKTGTLFAALARVFVTLEGEMC
jgi:hypothetical protein